MIRQVLNAVLAITFLFLVCGASAQNTSGGDFKGKVVIVGTGPQLETSIDIIAKALEEGGVPFKVVGEGSRRAENDKLATNGGVSILYLNQEITPRMRPKLVVTCYDADGKTLWEEVTNASFTMTAYGSAKKLAERIAKKLSSERIGGPGLPKK